LSGRGAEDIARIILEDRIDILIDLAGYTSAAQPTVLAARPAPIQIAWLGYLGTSGGGFMDYIIADDVVLPPELARYYTEHVIRLPCFLVTSPPPAADRSFSRRDAGLGEEGFVFCSFNQPYKLDRPSFEAWMEILRRVPDSKLWLYAPDTEVCGRNLRHEARQLNVAPERLVFAQRAPMAEHMARMALADLALDPFHISGGATSAAILSAGVPLLTLRGNSFLARMGSSINARLGMDDLDSIEPEQYVAKAVHLATTASELTALRNGLGKARQTSGFFDTRTFVYRLEEALLVAWDRHQAGQPPVDIRVSESKQS
jgi:predicted O-linked N-acetylglucosamine transferase (SPINDLY family)